MELWRSISVIITRNEHLQHKLCLRHLPVLEMSINTKILNASLKLSVCRWTSDCFNRFSSETDCPVAGGGNWGCSEPLGDFTFHQWFCTISDLSKHRPETEGLREQQEHYWQVRREILKKGFFLSSFSDFSFYRFSLSITSSYMSPVY